MPISQQRISPLLDAAGRLLLVRCREGHEFKRKEVVLPQEPPTALARKIAELRVDMLLCAAASEPLLRELEQVGVQVRSHLCGEIEAVLQAFCQDRLHLPEFRMPGCGGPHSGRNCCRSRRAWRVLKMNFRSNNTQTTT